MKLAYLHQHSSLYFFNTTCFTPPAEVSINSVLVRRLVTKIIIFPQHTHSDRPKVPKVFLFNINFSFGTHNSARQPAWFVPSRAPSTPPYLRRSVQFKNPRSSSWLGNLNNPKSQFESRSCRKANKLKKNEREALMSHRKMDYIQNALKNMNINVTTWRTLVALMYDHITQLQ